MTDRLATRFNLEAAFLAQGCRYVAGVDEVGRGSWAGPLVSAAVIFPTTIVAVSPDTLCLIRDSKQLTAKERTVALAAIRVHATGIGIGWATSAEIDHGGLARANRVAMLRAVRRLRVVPDALIIDHLSLPECRCVQTSLPRAESLSLSVAAASIVAKVTRDRLMSTWDGLCPGYGFASHKGYGTAVHRQALELLGPCRLHRRSFAPVARRVTA